MGYAVDEMVSWPSGYVAGVVNHHDQWRWEHPFQRYAELLQTSTELQAVAQVHLTHWRGRRTRSPRVRLHWLFRPLNGQHGLLRFLRWLEQASEGAGGGRVQSVRSGVLPIGRPSG